MPITFVNRQLIDSSHVAEPNLTKAASSLLINSKKQGRNIDLFLKI